MENKQKKGLKRNPIDKFYTKPLISELCLSLVSKYIKIKDDIIIEPSAGNGSFIPGIKNLTNTYLFYDLEPEHPEIIKQDYLTLDLDLNKPCHVIGNPPFGRQSSLAIKFIKKSCLFCDTISFILPKSFKKDSLKKAFSLYFHLIHEVDLPDKSFLVNEVEHHVEAVFQIWEKKTYPREIATKIKPIHFMFVEKNQNPDISFRRGGVNAGKIDTNIDKSIQSHYFIKFTSNKNQSNIIDKLSNISYDFNNTVGPKSISKQELIIKFNPIFID